MAFWFGARAGVSEGVAQPDQKRARRLLDNDRASAAEDFRRSMAAGRRNAEEYEIAAAELKALGG